MKIKAPPKGSIIYFLILVAIFKPAFLPFSWLTYIYRGVQAIGLVYLLLQTASRKLKNSKLMLLLAGYYGFLTLSTLFNSGDLIELFEEILTTLLVILWVHNMSERYPTYCVNQLMAVLSILIISNLISILLFPTGLYRSEDSVISARYGWVLGHQTLFAMYAAPTICIAALYWDNRKNIGSALFSLLVFVACVFQIFRLGSANNLMCILIITLVTVGMYIFRMKKFNFTLIYVVVASMVLLISVFQATSFMEPFVVKYLHRDMTFTQRTSIWVKALALIKDHWLFGCGVQSGEVLQSQLGTVHAHNQYIQCMYLGGIIVFVFYLAILFVSFKNLEKYAMTFPGRVFIAAVIALMVQMIFEVYFHHTMGKLLIVLSFYFGKIYFAEQSVSKGRRRGKYRWKHLSV